jgi:RHS repeat-associated protein
VGTPSQRHKPAPAAKTHSWYTTDALGSVRAISSNAGIASAVANYDPYGGLQGSAIGSFGFTGELQQGSNVYLRARWYNASAGTLYGRDPFAGMPETPYSQHYFQYGYANPVLFTDPSGECYSPFEFLRKAEPGNCANLDAAYRIYEHPRASAEDRGKALTYITAFWAGHGIGAIGIAGLGYAAASAASLHGAVTLQTTGAVAAAHAPGAATALGTGLLALNAVDDIAAWAAALCGDTTAAGLVQIGLQDGASPLADVVAFGMIVGGRRNVFHAADGGGNGWLRRVFNRSESSVAPVVHSGLGSLSGRQFRVDAQDITLIERHLSRPELDEAHLAPENVAMLQRLRAAAGAGRNITGADASFYFHELTEAKLMDQGMPYEEAHQLALDTFGVSNFSVYNPEVIRELGSEYFNKNWFRFWGIES